MSHQQVNRNIYERVIASLDSSPVVLLNGARQTGKSTIAQQIVDSGKLRSYITLDDPLVLSALLSSPVGFLESLPLGTVLDEIQRAPEVFTALKFVVDKDRQKGRFLLTGSANVLLLPKLSDSLAGRMQVHTLRPLSQGEIEGRREDFIDWAFSDEFENYTIPESSDITDRLITGGYPEIISQITGENERYTWYQNYLNLLLVRDIKDISNIEQAGMMPILLKILAARTGNLVNYNDISRSISNLNAKTLSRYTNILELLYIIEQLPAWYANYSKRLIKSPKTYLSDTGFITFLLGIGTDAVKNDRTLYGNLLENFVYQELQKQKGWSRTVADMYFMRTSDGDEIDFILEDTKGRIVAIEIKATTSIDTNDVDKIRKLKNEMGSKFHRGIVLYTGTQVYKADPSLYFMPIQGLWKERKIV
jgi:uncharacterized protein